MVFSINESLINSNDVVAVALSGGKDSVFLLYQLHALQSKLGFKLCAVNVEHGIRGEESKQNSQFCLELAKSLDIPFKGYEVDAITFSKQYGYSLEQGARILRYDCFFDAIKSGFCDKIATAHHKNDLCETVLFNLFRGSGLRGAKIDAVGYDGKIIRPILGVSRQEIDCYIAQNDIKYVHDKTNDDNAFSRNYIRNKIMPTVCQKFPNAADSIYRFSQYSASDDEYLYSLAKECLTVKNGSVLIPVTAAKPVLSRATVLALAQLGVKKDYTAKHIDAVVDLAKNFSGKKLDLLGGVQAVKRGDFIELKVNGQNCGFCFDFAVKKIETLSGIIEIERVQNADLSTYSQTFGRKILYFDGDKIPQNAVVRTPVEGDFFTKFNGGTKSLKKYLTDKKIYSMQRKTLPVLCAENEVLCVFGIEISDKIKITADTKNILKATFFPVDN